MHFNCSTLRLLFLYLYGVSCTPPPSLSLLCRCCQEQTKRSRGRQNITLHCARLFLSLFFPFFYFLYSRSFTLWSSKWQSVSCEIRRKVECQVRVTFSTWNEHTHTQTYNRNEWTCLKWRFLLSPSPLGFFILFFFLSSRLFKSCYFRSLDLPLAQEKYLRKIGRLASSFFSFLFSLPLPLHLGLSLASQTCTLNLYSLHSVTFIYKRSSSVGRSLWLGLFILCVVYSTS